MDHNPDNQEPQQTPDGTPSSETPEQRTLGDFVIRREIGRGGMGTVYEAWQTSLQRVVALKVLAPHVSASAKAIIRFVREAQAAAKLHHTNIVPIFAQGEADGIHFYAMEYIRGSGLNEIIGELRGAEKSEYTPADLAETVALSAADTATSIPDTIDDHQHPANDSAVTLTAPSQAHATQTFYNNVTNHAACVADALDYAHECGVVHRDIKPHNLILGTDGHIRISDFGLARLAEQPGVTTTGEMIGSPLYMAPEQITGSVGDVDHRADIYSLGATLYEWLTLTPPYPGETRERVISCILTRDAVAPRTINPNIPIDLETIVLKAIEKDPNRRYQTAGEVRDDLRRYLASQPIVARRARMHTRVAKFIARHQLATVGLIALIVAGTLFVTLRQTQHREAQQRAAALRARADAAVVQQDNEQLLYAISLFQGGPTKLAEAALTGVQGIVGNDTEDAPSGEEQATSVALPDVGTPAGIGLTTAEEYYLSVAPSDWPPQPTPGNDAANHLYAAVLHWLDDEVVEARRLLTSYIDDKPNDFDALQLYAVIACLSGHFDEIATAANRMAMFPGHDIDAAVWVGISDLLSNRPDQAMAALDRALSIDDTRDLVHVLHGLSAIQSGKTEVAMQDFDAVSAHDPESIPAMLGRTSALFASGRYDEAIPVATKILDLSSAGRARAHALALRGDCRTTLGDHEKAASDYQEAIDIEGQTLALMVKKATAQYQLINRKRIAGQQGEPQTTGNSPAGPPQAQKGTQQPVGPLFDFLNRRPRHGKSPRGGLQFPFGKIVPPRGGR